MPEMRIKMRIIHIVKHDDATEELRLAAVVASATSEEDSIYAKHTPSGMLSVTNTNPNLIGRFVEGEAYYLDFTPVEAAGE